MSRTSLLRPAVALTALLVALPATACDFFAEDPTPDTARLVLSSESGAQVLVLISREFVAAETEGGVTSVQLFNADTLTVSTPFERTVDIREAQQFFVQSRAADSVSTTVRMRVFLDGELRYDETQDLNTTPLQFLYLFNRPILADVDVL